VSVKVLAGSIRGEVGSVTPRRGNPKLHVARKCTVAAVKAEADSYASVIPIIREAQEAGHAYPQGDCGGAQRTRYRHGALFGQRYAQSVANILNRA
jgi:hypothetical protein